MTPIVAALTEDDFTDVAAYLRELEPERRRTDAARLEVGRRIYTEGNADEGLPACITCHRPSGSGIRPDFPRLFRSERGVSRRATRELDGRSWQAGSS